MEVWSCRANPNGEGEIPTWPQSLGERQKVTWRWGGDPAQCPRGLYGWGNVGKKYTKESYKCGLKVSMDHTNFIVKVVSRWVKTMRILMNTFNTSHEMKTTQIIT